MTRKPTATQRLDALLDDLRQAVTELRDKADSYLRTAKAYTCRSNEPIKAGIVKGAAVLRMDADKIEAIIRKHEHGQAVEAREPHPPAGATPAAVGEVGEVRTGAWWPSVEAAGGGDQAAGHVHVSGVQEGDA